VYAIGVVENLGLELAALDGVQEDGLVAARFAGEGAKLVRVDVDVVQERRKLARQTMRGVFLKSLDSLAR
jgi:hypothetical protein